MVKRIGSLITLLILVLTECFTPMSYVLAEINAEQDFQIEENNIQEEEEEVSEDIEEENIGDSLSDREEENDDNEEGNIQESSDNVLEGQEDMEDEEEDIQNSSLDMQDDNNEEVGNENLLLELEDNGDSEGEDNTQNSSTEILETQTGSEVDTSNLQENNQENGENNIQDNEEQNTQDSSVETPEIQTGTQTGSGVDTGINIPQGQEEEKEGGVIETITEEIQEIITKIRYFFKRELDSRYIKYGRDSNNIGTITLKDPKTSASITIMDKNLGAESVGVGRSSYGNYFQWGNNSGVKTVNGSNKTTEKAIYKDSYYNRGYDGKGMFIVGGRDYWENGDHYNSLWGNESKESSRYGSCPVGYHIPTVKEWNQLLSIWGKIHTQDTTKNGTVLRYSADYAARNIHTFKGAATHCAQGENECVDEDKLSIIIETLSEELKLPLAGSYDENGNYEEGLGVYWTTMAKDGNKAGVFDMNVYIGNGVDERLEYKAQGHNIRCFQNIYPYEAPVEIEVQGEEEKLGTGNEINSLDNKEGLENEKQDSYSGKNIPSEFISHTLVLDTTKDFMNVELGANGGKFSDEKGSKTVKYGYYNEEATIDVNALKQDEYRSGYEVEEILPTPVGYKLMDEIEIPTREGYIFEGWYTEVDGGEKVDFENLLVSEGMKVYAHWTLKEYTITWKNEDGTIRDTTQVAYGQIPTHEDITQPADAKYTYVFKGWEPEIKEVTGDAEYRATYIYTLRKYTVTWKNEDETVLKTEEVEYGTIPTYDGEEPTKESTEEFEYIFTGWDKEISEIKGDIEYIAKYDAKEKINKNIEDFSTEVSELQTGDIESGSALDLLEELLDDQAETGEVLEYTDEDRELELTQIRTKLNNKKIKGKETYNNITVNVEAPKNSFPEGVELRISPIIGDAENQAIKEQLMENGNVTAESELVSFDISFIYTLSNGEEVEIQPKDGNTVKVSFNYKNNNKFNKGKKDKNKDLKIYHFEKVKNKKNRKSEETKIKEIKVNESESTQGEIVIDAENFSIYTLAAADGGLRGVDMCTVTFVNGECYFGTQEEDGICNFDMPEPIEIECGSTISRQVIDEPYYTNTTSKYDASYNYNYYFSRWSTRENPGYTNTSYNYNFSTSVTSDLTLYAIGTYKSSQNGSNNANYTKTVTFNANGGTLTSTGSMLYGMYGLIKQPSDPIRAGYKLNCWTTSQNGSCSNAYDFNSTTNTVTDNVNLYAQWTVLTYTIAFSAGNMDAQGSTSSINASYNTPSYAPDCGFYKEGYICSEWNTDINGNGTRYKPGDELLNLTGTNNATVTLYAQWGEAVTITFNSNGGSTIEPLTLASGYTATQPADPTKTGYRLVGWFTDSELTSEFNFSTPITADITLYAKWEESNTLTVTFNANGGVLAGESSQEVEYGERVTKPADPTKSGSGFMYWTTDEEGNNEYDFKTPVTEDLILYAQWAKICTVTFANGRCYRNQSNQSTCDFTLPDSIKVACGTPVRRPENPSSFTTSSRFNSYTYYFSRWSKVNNASYDNTSNDWNFDDPVTTDRTLYAMGNSTTYTVTFNANSGVLAGGSTQDVDTMGRNATVRKPDDPSRTGYDFKRWSRQNSTTEYDFTTQITTNTTLVAQWTPHTYTIRYNANGGVGSMDNTDMTYDVAKNLSLNTFTKDNASFSGWNTKVDGTGTPYGNGVSVNNLTDVAGRTINLYAQWNCNNGYHDENGICVSDIQNCPLPAILGGGTLAHGSGMTVYSTAGGQCPTICTAGTITCNNGILEGNTGYNYTGCNLAQLDCDASFTLNSTGANGTYSGCTSYTVNANSCNAGTTVYKLTNCASGYHTEDNSICTGNIKTVACTQSGKPDHSSYVAGNVQITWQGTWNNGSWSTADNCAWTCDPHYHTGANNNSCEIDTFQITWLDGNGQPLTTDTVNYGVTPSYNGTTPTKTATAQYSYTFNNTRSPAILPATADATYTAQFTETVNQYTATITANPDGYGTVSSGLVTADYGASIFENGNTLTIGTTTVVATPMTGDAQYTYIFSGWNNTCGISLITGCIIQAQFEREVNKYTVTWKNDDNSILEVDTGVEYGTIPTYDGPIPQKTGSVIYAYTFSGWNPEVSEVHGDQIYTATYTRDTRKYKVTWRNINGTVLETDNNVAYGSTPEYNGTTPSNGVSNQYVTSTFAGWNPALSTVVANVEYMARYTYALNSGYVLDTSKDPVNLTLNANGGIFSNNSGYDILNYDYYNRAEKKYSHSSNYSDDGVRNTSATVSDDGQYVTTITGAEYLYLNLTYDLHEILLGLANSSKDKLFIHAGTSVNDELIASLSGNTNAGIQGNVNYIITGDSVLLDFYLANRNISDYESNGFYAVIVGVIPVGYITDDEAQTPTREGYIFDGWYTQAEGGDEIDVDNILMTGNMEVFAHWIPNTNTQYIVYHYVKKVGENKYTLAETETGHGETDAILVLSGLAKNEYPCASYDKGSLTGTENGPGEIVTQTTIKGDGSTKIYLYYNRNSYTVHLSGDKGVDYLEINGERKTEAVRECGSEVPVNAVPKPGYHFVRWDREERTREEENELGGE